MNRIQRSATIGVRSPLEVMHRMVLVLIGIMVVGAVMIWTMLISIFHMTMLTVRAVLGWGGMIIVTVLLVLVLPVPVDYLVLNRPKDREGAWNI